jgi:hypothetical protein
MSIATMPATALRLLTKYGKSVTFTRVTQGAYDPATSTAPTTTTSTAVKALVEDYNKQTDGAAFVNGLVLEGDKKVTVAATALGFTPTPGDQVGFDGGVLTVKNVKATFAGEVAATYELHVRT